MKHAATTALLAALLSSCALIEPSSRSQFSAKPGTSEESVFSCAEATIKSLQTDRGNWVNSITTKDVKSGTFETGNFSEFNHVGIRTQIIYTKDTGEVLIKIKASGPYLIDLGAEQAVELLAKGMSQCL